MTHTTEEVKADCNIGFGWANQQFELHGSSMSSFGVADQDFLPIFVEMALMPSPTPVGQPLWVPGVLETKDGRGMRVYTTQQFLYSQRRMVLRSSHEPILIFNTYNTQHDTHRRNGSSCRWTAF
jgi:hypothetical protein